MTGVVLVQVAGMAPQAVLDRMQSMAPIRPTESMVQQALSGGTGGTYLAPALYRPVVQAMASPCYSTVIPSLCHQCVHNPVSITKQPQLPRCCSATAHLQVTTVQAKILRNAVSASLLHAHSCTQKSVCVNVVFGRGSAASILILLPVWRRRLQMHALMCCSLWTAEGKH